MLTLGSSIEGIEPEEVPHALVVVPHLAAAAHGEAQLGILPAVEGAAGAWVALEEVDVLGLHLGIADR